DVSDDTSLPDHFALGKAPLWRSRLVTQSGKPWRGQVATLIDQMIARHEKRIAFLRSLKDGRRDPR
ncbi:MAG: hypothetical protein E6165_05780, partial [Varibaculum cambriense]|nr:hypothetical protein [Varibaculum cambriense]